MDLCPGCDRPENDHDPQCIFLSFKNVNRPSPLSAGLDNREVFADGLIELWPHLKRATQLDVINRLREQPKAMLKPLKLQVLETNLKTEQG